MHNKIQQKRIPVMQYLQKKNINFEKNLPLSLTISNCFTLLPNVIKVTNPSFLYKFSPNSVFNGFS